MARRGLRCLLAGLLLACLHADADFVFRVPEVMVRHAAAPKSVGTGPHNATATANATANNTRWPDERVEVHYEEYFVEHEISTVDARKAAQALDLNNLQVPGTRLGCAVCSRREMEYCEAKVVADHCCCERHFIPEAFPFLPHTCYLGSQRCRPLAHDCALYSRLRDCCCYDKLAHRWKGILSKSAPVGSMSSGASLLLLSMLLFVVYL